MEAMTQSKHQRMEEFVRSRQTGGGYPACYELFFSLFNSGEYYEAHDVLEHLWLESKDSNQAFYKGLIQIAGAFVHLQKQFLRPGHPKDGKRLRPGFRLLALGASNIRPYGPMHMGIDVEAVCADCAGLANAIEASGYQINPWSPENLPQIALQCGRRLSCAGAGDRF